MTHSLEELSRKDIINVDNGCRIGCVRDIELGENGAATAVTVERTAGNSLFKKPETVKIKWSDIVVIGKETILVRNVPEWEQESVKKSRLTDIF